MTSPIRNGMDARKIVTMSSFVIVDTTFRHIPTGGVTSPTAMPTIRMAPNCIGETPSAFMAGMNTGLKRMIAGATSTKNPTCQDDDIQHQQDDPKR